MNRLTQDALAIWNAGVDAVRSDRVLRESLRWEGKQLEIGGKRIDLANTKRLIIVGAGKATAGMLQGLLDTIDQRWETTGWINVPEGAVPGLFLSVPQEQDKLRTVRGVSICEARPVGVNEPTKRVLEGTQQILKLVQHAGSEDAVIFLLSGGGSALLCAPHEWLSLETKIAITRALSSRGAGIQELNAVRRALSQVKGGGLARRTTASHLVTLVISDVLGDPLEMIGSGPTVLDPPPDAMLAARLLEQYAPGEFREVVSRLRQSEQSVMQERFTPVTSAHTFVLANNLTAVTAAAERAEELGYTVQSESRTQAEGAAQGVALEIAERFLGMEHRSAWISGGEPTVVLADESIRGRGGRNQHLVLAAARALLSDPIFGDLRRSIEGQRESMVLVSGGTDGEDGATPAAGAWIDSPWLSEHLGKLSEIEEALRRCDSNAVFERSGRLLLTGPTHTNVCDLRVSLRG